MTKIEESLREGESQKKEKKKNHNEEDFEKGRNLQMKRVRAITYRYMRKMKKRNDSLLGTRKLLEKVRILRKIAEREDRGKRRSEKRKNEKIIYKQI